MSVSSEVANAILIIRVVPMTDSPVLKRVR